ncbi:MAG: hypothetical protein WKF96_22050 [Solirubrobacteraceae bacterium]
MPENVAPSVPVGIATVLSIISALAAGVGAVIAAAAGNDVATASASAAGILAVLGGAGGRYAQAIATIKAAAAVAGPWIDAAQDALEPGNDAMLAEQGIPVEDLDER